VIVGPDDRLYIEDGVHRGVAAHRLGLRRVPAVLKRTGGPDELVYPEPDRLCSPERVIGRWDRGRDFLDLVEVLSTAEGRARLRPIQVHPLGAPGQSGSVPIADVVVEEA